MLLMPMEVSTYIYKSIDAAKLLRPVLYKTYDIGHSLLCYVSQTQMFNKPATEASSLNKCSFLACALGVTKFITICAMFLVTLCCAT
jgi:hypothetical protein